MEAQHPNSAKAGSVSCGGPSSAPAATPDLAADPSRVWLPELVQRIATFLPRNAIPCILRLVDSATAAQFSGWKHRTIHLSEPVPHGLFAARWSPPRATRNLPLELRCRLVALTAASGVVENMPVALAAAGCLVQPALLGYAAAAGQVKVGTGCAARVCVFHFCGMGTTSLGSKYFKSKLNGNVLLPASQMCAWLHINGCPAVKMDDELDVLALAAARGHKEVGTECTETLARCRHQ